MNVAKANEVIWFGGMVFYGVREVLLREVETTLEEGY